MKGALVWLSLTLAVYACSPPGDVEPPALVARVDFEQDGFSRVTQEPRLHLALLWAAAADSSRPYLLTANQAVEASAGGRPQPTRLRYSLPDEAWLERLVPRETAFFLNRETPAYRPQVILYDDRDGDGTLTLEPEPGPSDDAVIGLGDAEPTNAALLDVDGLLSTLPLDASETYYSVTGGYYTPFVEVLESGNQLLAIGPAAPVRVRSGPPATLAALVACRRAPARTQPQTEGWHIDERLGSAFCAAGPVGCQIEELERSDPPQTAAHSDRVQRRRSQCRRRSDVSVLLVSSQELTCDEDCDCTRDTDLALWAASPEALPSWWPCGDSVDYCDEAGDVVDFISGCGSPSATDEAR